MWNYKYLSATLDILDRKLLLEEGSKLKGEDHLEFTVVKLEDNLRQRLIVPVAEIAEIMRFDWASLENRVNLHRRLISKGPLSLTDCMAYFYLYECVKGLVSNVQSTEQGIIYTYSGQLEHLLLPKKDVQEQKRRCLSAECVLGGYSIAEYMGKHHVVRTPGGLEHLVTHGHCGCNEYLETRNCNHIYLVAQCDLDRKAFLEAKVLNLLA